MGIPHCRERSRNFRIVLAGFALAFGLAVQGGTGQTSKDEPWLGLPFSSDPKSILRAALGLRVPEGTDVHVLSDERTYVYEEDGRRTSTRRQVYYVVTPDGAENWSDVGYDWEPWHQERPQIRARVITKDGAVHNLDPKTLSESEVGNQGDKTFSDRRTLSGPLPAVAPGSVIEEEAVIKDKAPFFDQGETVRVPFTRSMPVHHSLLTIDAPASIPLRYEVHLLPTLQPRRSETKGRIHLVFEQGPVEANDDLPGFLPSEHHRYPNVTFSTGASWQAVASRYAEQVDAQLRGLDPKVLLGDVAANQGSDAVARLLARLHVQVRYTGVEFGEAALVPRSPAEVLQRGYGDCKDKSALLVAMLRAAGQPAYLALLLTSPSHDIDPALAGMGRFDHAIVYLPGNPAVWIDATDEYARPGDLPPADQGRLALIVSPETKDLVRTAESTAANNQTVETREFFLADMGPARVVETTEVTGSTESSYRASYGASDAKEVQDSLARYTRQEYVSEDAPKFDFSDARDFARKFRLRLEITRARRGFTELTESAVAIPLEDITASLPRELRSAEPKTADDNKDKPKPPRTTDWLLDEASVQEWRYKIHPPAGFRAASLPKSSKTQMGPASLMRDFAEEPDGSVTATFRFELTSRRFTAAQAQELRKGILALGDEEALIIKFAHRGFALLETGKTREALAEFRGLASATPASAAHFVRLAYGLLDAGLGEAARAAARKATDVDPKSALPWKTLAWILQHDELGRRFGKGFDHQGAWDAYRKALELDSTDNGARADMGILLEHDSRGERYGAGARLDLAIDAYVAAKEVIKGTDLANNLAIDYLRARRPKECQEWLKVMPNSQKRRIYQLLATALDEGAAAAIRQAAKEITDESERRTCLYNAALILMDMREYRSAGDIFASAARGADNAAQIMGQAELFSRMQRYEDMKLSEDDPKTVVKRFFALLLSPEASKDQLASVVGRLNAEELNDPEEEQNRIALIAGMKSSLARSGLSILVARDILLNNTEMSQDGDPGTGFRIRLHLPGTTLSILVMREDGAYRVIDVLSAPSVVGAVVLSLTENNRIEAARKILDWVREDLTPAGGDDPYAGSAFPRLWQRGQTGDRDAIRAAAASLITEARRYRQALEVLIPARQKASAEAARNAIGIALAAAYSAGEDYEKLLAVASNLLRSAPKSDAAFLLTVSAQQKLKRWNDAAGTIAARLKLLPDDLIALHAQVELNEWQGEFGQAVDALQHMTSLGRAGANEWNSLAWDALFLDALPKDAMANAQKAASLSQNNDTAILHTLAAVLAVSGRAGEARSLMLQILGMQGLEEPDGSIWLLYGMIAEDYGEKDVAAAAYKKIEAKRPVDRTPNSSYQLAQRLLKLLESGTDHGKQLSQPPL